MSRLHQLGAAIEGTEFAVYVNGKRIDSQTEGVLLEGTEERSGAGAAETRHVVATYRYDPLQLAIESHVVGYEGEQLVRRWVSVRNEGADAVTVERVDSFVLRLPADDWTVLHYKSEWGAEFEPVRVPLTGEDVILETRKGRSSKDMHPWMSVIGSGGDVLTVSPMWSGNWVLRCVFDEGAYAVSGGLHDWEFSKALQPGQAMDGVHVAMAVGSGGDLNTTSIPFARVGRKHWYAQNGFSQSLPAEWNHWWSYEDKTINEEVFRANAAEAAKLGIEICTLDAGWFGPSDVASEWYEYRGDWEMVNTVRFPSGIRALSDYVHGLGMKFGLWCEIEAVGKSAALSQRYPSFPARRDGEPLGYLCFGNPEVQDWAAGMLDKLIGGYDCQWIKLDFNLDPQAGCNCTDHGHGAGDGVYEHYNGYYRVLDRVRAMHPEVILENCSSGGLRIDLGMMQHTHTTFLSDPDWPEHSLQVFWGATTMLAPEVCLHWSYSEFLWDYEKQRFNPQSPDLKPHQFDYYTRIAMMRGFGISQKLPQMPEWMRARLAHHIGVYRDKVKPFVRSADLYRLTGQPVRGGLGDCWSAFQYSMPEGEKHIVFAFRLPGGEEKRTIALQGLEAEATYLVSELDGAGAENGAGADAGAGAGAVASASASAAGAGEAAGAGAGAAGLEAGENAVANAAGAIGAAKRFEPVLRTGAELLAEGIAFGGLEVEESVILSVVKQ